MNPIMNPQALAKMIINNNPALRNNPIINNAFNMANNNDTQGLDLLLNNVCRERGIDVNKAYNDAKNRLGM